MPSASQYGSTPDTAQPDKRIWLSASELVIAIRTCVAARRAFCVHGPRGVGKSTIIRDLMVAAGCSWQLEPVYRRDRVDYSGLPIPTDDRTETNWATPRALARANRAARLLGPTRPHLIFWDEFNRAHTDEQNATMGIILDGTNGDYDLDPNVVHGMAVNDAVDSTGVYPMTDAANNRVIHFYFNGDYAGWRLWALRLNGPITGDVLTFKAPYADGATGRIRVEVLTYLDLHPEHYNVPVKGSDASASPRSWEFVSDVISPDLPSNVERALIYGSVGPDIGLQFGEHLRILRLATGQVSFARILAHPSTEPIPAEMSLAWAVASRLSGLMDTTNAPAIVTYLDRMSTEQAAFAILHAIRRTGTPANDYADSPLHDVGAINAWKGRHSDIF